MAKTTYKDMAEAEQRDHWSTAVRPAFGRSYCYITCPFCGQDVKAFIWSLCGGGKRCPCGALHCSNGVTYKKKEKADETPLVE